MKLKKSFSLSVPLTPPSGLAFFYLVRAENACGAGPLGQDSDGGDRTGAVCLP